MSWVMAMGAAAMPRQALLHGATRCVMARTAARCMGSTAHDKVIGFIGLGNMGSKMAANLIKAGRTVLVHDAALDRAEAVVRGHPSARAVDTLEALGQEADVVITMLPNTSHVEAVHRRLLPATRPNTLLIDSSTIAPAASAALAARASAAGAAMIDAPVSGGVPAATAATLTFMVGGGDTLFGRAEPVLQLMGARALLCGGPGAGCAAKLCNNLALAISMVGTAEGMALGVRLGLRPETVAHVFNTSTARCWSSDTYNPYPGVMEGVPASRGYTGGFSADLMEKDLHLALDSARAAHSAAPMGALAHQLYSLMQAHGQGSKDFSAVLELIAGGDLPPAGGGGGSAVPR